MGKREALIVVAFLIAFTAILTYDVPTEIEYSMVGEKWYVGQIKYGIELTATERSGLFGSENVAYFNVNGTTYSYKDDSTVILGGVKFSIELVRAEGGYIRVKWR